MAKDQTLVYTANVKVALAYYVLTLDIFIKLKSTNSLDIISSLDLRVAPDQDPNWGEGGLRSPSPLAAISHQSVLCACSQNQVLRGVKHLKASAVKTHTAYFNVASYGLASM